MSPGDQQAAELLGNAVVMFVVKVIGFLIVLAIVRWGLDIGRILKNQKETNRLLEEIRDRIGGQDPDRGLRLAPDQKLWIGAPGSDTNEDPAAGDLSRGKTDWEGRATIAIILAILLLLGIIVAIGHFSSPR